MPADEQPLGKLDGVELPAAADMHVHLREGDMTELVVYVRALMPLAAESNPWQAHDPPRRCQHCLRYGNRKLYLT